MITSPADRELLLSRAYEHALCSAYAHGVSQSSFRFSLPQPDDFVTLADGTRDFRMNTSFHGFLPQEVENHQQLTRILSSHPLSFPDYFSEDADTIRELHQQDLSDIAFGLLRAKKMNAQHASLFSFFIQASFAFHEALLHATAALPSLTSPEIAHQFIRQRPASLMETLFETQEQLILLSRRFQHPAFAQLMETGARDQVMILLKIGDQLGVEKDFFVYQLQQHSSL